MCLQRCVIRPTFYSYVALVLTDGRQSASTTSGGVLLMRPTPEDELPAGMCAPMCLGRALENQPRRTTPRRSTTTSLRPAVKTWQVVCECWWRGNRVDAWDVEHPAGRDVTGREFPAYTTRDVPEMIGEKLYQQRARTR